MTEVELLSVIAEILHRADDPQIVGVATIGGGAKGLPGLRVEHPDGNRSFLMTTADATPAIPVFR